MSKRIAIEFFGQLRHWELQRNLDSLVEFFKADGYAVDILGTFWDDTYSRKVEQQGGMDVFSRVQLIREPEIDNSFNLTKYFYSLENSRDQRRRYEEEHNYTYEFIILSRPDVDFIGIHHDHDKDWLNFKQLIAKHENEPKCFTFPGTVITNPLGAKRMEDKTFICNPSAANLIGDTYKFYLNGEPTFEKLSYHSSLYNSVSFFNIELLQEIKFFRINLFRHKIILESGIDDETMVTPKDRLREYSKQFQDSKDLILFLKSLGR